MYQAHQNIFSFEVYRKKGKFGNHYAKLLIKNNKNRDCNNNNFKTKIIFISNNLD